MMPNLPTMSSDVKWSYDHASIKHFIVSKVDFFIYDAEITADVPWREFL